MKRNLILISLDTVRADVGYSGQFSTINYLRTNGVSFINTIASTPLTPGSHASVFTGLYPYHHGIRHLFRERLSPTANTLAQYMKTNGYSTGGIVSCPGMNKWYGFNKGFNHYDDEIPRLPDGSDPLETVDVKVRGMALKRAPLVRERAIEWLEEHINVPFFLFIHFFDAHWPYEAPEFLGGSNAYEQEIAYSDHYLGRIIDYLMDKDLLEKTDIVLFSDHGEDLCGLYPNDKGGEDLGRPEEFGHGCLLYDQTIKTMLIMISNNGNIPSGKKITTQVRLIDLMPTVLAMKAIQHDPDVFDGISLLPLMKNNADRWPVAYSETLYPSEQNENS